MHPLAGAVVRALSTTISQTKSTQFGGFQFSIVKQVIGFDRNTSSLSFAMKDDGSDDAVNLIVFFLSISAAPPHR